jgi:hypothetical protein
LSNAVTGKPISTARLLIEIDLPSNTFIERQKTFIFRVRKIHHANLAAEREAYLMGLFLLSQRHESRLKFAAIPLLEHSLHGGGLSCDRAALVAGPSKTPSVASGSFCFRYFSSRHLHKIIFLK